MFALQFSVLLDGICSNESIYSMYSRSLVHSFTYSFTHKQKLIWLAAWLFDRIYVSFHFYKIRWINSHIMQIEHETNEWGRQSNASIEFDIILLAFIFYINYFNSHFHNYMHISPRSLNSSALGFHSHQSTQKNMTPSRWYLMKTLCLSVVIFFSCVFISLMEKLWTKIGAVYRPIGHDLNNETQKNEKYFF